MRSSWAIVGTTLAIIVSGCGSDAEGGPSATFEVAASASPVADEPTTTQTPSDRDLVQAALITPGDFEGRWRSNPDFLWPNSAELARTAPACASFADLVFEGGAEHGTGASVTLNKIDGEGATWLSYVVIFPTADQAAEMVQAVASPEFDGCWSQFQTVAMKALPMGVTEASYEKTDPPDLELVADSYVVRSVVGTATIDGSEFGDTCICIFAQVGRGVVEIHSPAEDADPQERTEVAQVAIDKLREVLG
jgi:hypothetical protein